MPLVEEEAGGPELKLATAPAIRAIRERNYNVGREGAVSMLTRTILVLVFLPTLISTLSGYCHP